MNKKILVLTAIVCTILLFRSESDAKTIECMTEKIQWPWCAYLIDNSK